MHGRRMFERRAILTAGAGLAATGMGTGTGGGGADAAAEVPKKPQPGAPRATEIKLPAGAKVPVRRLGRTGAQVSAVGVGGFHIGNAADEQTAVRIVRAALDHGVNFLDNCWDYNDGRSERWMGRALGDGYRQRAFLMTKIDGRTKKAAAEQIEQSLRALATDVIDLMQLHEVIRPSDAGRVFGADGAMEALRAAKQAGKIRFIGFTGHKSPAIHLGMLNAGFDHGFTFDTVQMPLNVMDAHFDSFERRVLPVLLQHDIGVLGMKPLGSGLFLQSAPLAQGTVAPIECLQYALSLPTSVVITGCETMGILQQAIDAALRPPLDQAARQALLDRTKAAATAGAWEKYKTSDMFDGTAQHPWWLETASLGKPA
ncbi:MAG TPA: aldo/keto reductase [Polyangia bacterium]|nr:aldo/keto reductase [Polyangia bacterium]